MASPMPSQWDSDYTTGLPEPSGRIIDPRSMVGNALWNYGKSAASSIYENIIKPPGQILFGERSPYSMDIPQYAADLALTGFGIRGANLLTRGGAFDPTSIEHFPAWHGTPARQPFREFDDDFIGSGEGAQAFGWGHYVAGAKRTGEDYRSKLAGRGKVLLGDDGLPLNDYQVAQKYYEPGTIVPGYGGIFQKVDAFHPGPANYPYGWSVTSREVVPNIDLMGQAYGQGFINRYRSSGRVPADALNNPDMWIELGPAPYQARSLNHATMPTDRDIEHVAAARGPDRGWKLGEPGGLLHINVIPEEHELLDHDLPWSQQHPEVRRKLTEEALSPHDLPHVTPERGEMMTGGQLYKSLVESNRDFYDMGRDEARQVVSQDMNAAGVPGIKFLDARSRGKSEQLTLNHSTNLDTAPDVDLARRYLGDKDVPATTGSVEGELRVNRDVINRAIERRNIELRRARSDLSAPSSPEFLKAMGGHLRNLVENLPGEINKHQELLNWIDKEHAAGNFSIGDSRTRNYVIFDPRNLEIRTWNGRPLTPVPHNPFEVTATPVEGDPFKP